MHFSSFNLKPSFAWARHHSRRRGYIDPACSWLVSFGLEPNRVLVILHVMKIRPAHRPPKITRLCHRCGGVMTLERIIPRLGALLELRTYQCAGCNETIAEEDIDLASNANADASKL